MLDRICTALLLSFFTSCAMAAKPPSVATGPLPASMRIDHVLFVIEQSELEVDRVAPNRGIMSFGGVLPFAVAMGISSAQTHNRKKQAGPLQLDVGDAPLDRQLIDCILAHLPEVALTEGADFAVIRDQAEWQAKLVEWVPARILEVRLRYALRMNLDIAYVQVATQVLNYQRLPPTYEQGKNMTMTERIRAKPEVLRAANYFSEHVTHAPFGKQPKSPGKNRYQHNAAAWAESDSRRLNEAFVLAIEEVGRLLGRDLEAGLPAASAGSLIKAMTVDPIRPNRLLKVRLVEATEQRSLVQANNGWHWIDPRQIKR